MKKVSYLLATAAILPACSQSKDYTNIILINLDDVGYGDFSYNGAYGYTTPNIDRMAAEIEPEVPRDRMKVGIRLSYWYDQLEVLRSFASREYISATVDVLCEALELSGAERAAYFGDY